MTINVQDVFDPQLPTLMMAIHPKPVRQILAGIKLIEYRKRFFKGNFQAFVYTTGKQGGIQMFTKCGAPIQSSAKHLAQIGEQINHDSFDEIYDYFQDRESGCVIPIQAVYEITKIPLTELRQQLPSLAIPQAYFFLDKPAKRSLCQFLKEQPIITTRKHDWQSRMTTIDQILAQ